MSDFLDVLDVLDHLDHLDHTLEDLLDAVDVPACERCGRLLDDEELLQGALCSDHMPARRVSLVDWVPVCLRRGYRGRR